MAGAGATSGVAVGTQYPFRIDHDEKFNQTTHLQYTISRDGSWVNGLWGGFNWRYDSGLVAGSTPCYNVIDPNSLCAGTSILIGGQPGVDLSGLTADQEFEAGITCNGVAATLANGGFTSCLASQYTSNLVQIPGANTEDDDQNPQRIAPRSLFDATLGKNNIFNKEHLQDGPRPDRHQRHQQVRAV